MKSAANMALCQLVRRGPVNPVKKMARCGANNAVVITCRMSIKSRVFETEKPVSDTSVKKRTMFVKQPTPTMGTTRRRSDRLRLDSKVMLLLINDESTVVPHHFLMLFVSVGSQNVENSTRNPEKP